jgi:hypothetical protein
MNMAEGKLFIGQQAVDVGLADQVGTIENAKSLVRSMIDDNNYSFTVEDQTMEIKTSEELAEAFPSLVLDIQGSTRRSVEEEGKLEIKSERDRIVDLVKIQFGADQGESFGKLVHSDITPEIFKATKDLVGAKDDEPTAADVAKQKILDELKAAGAENPGADGNGNEPEKDYMTICNEYKLENKCSLLDAMRAVDKMKPDLRVSYIKAVNK